MKEILEELNKFEDRNNLSVMMLIHSDGSGSLREFWDAEPLASFKNTDDLKSYLKNTKYKLREDGRCISPVKPICNYCGKDEICEGSYPEGCFLENDILKHKGE